MAAKSSMPEEAQTQHEEDDRRKRQGSIQIVEFVLGTELFAIDLFDVKEVVEYTTITKLPNVAAYVKGIIDLRGEITTIIDLKHRLNITDGRQVAAESSRIIWYRRQDHRHQIGILVDDVTSVSTFEANQVDYTSGFGEQSGYRDHRHHQTKSEGQRQREERTNHLD